jgi:hypothetical protein
MVIRELPPEVAVDEELAPIRADRSRGCQFLAAVDTVADALVDSGVRQRSTSR